MSSFELALDFTQSAEKGYVKDTGGVTFHGVTQWTYNAYLASHGENTKPVEQITADEVKNLLFTMYWGPAHCDNLVPSVAIAHFDFAVNADPVEAIKLLQKSLGVVEDGLWGQVTQTYSTKANSSILPLLLNLRIQFYQNLANSQSKYEVELQGWLNRVGNLKAFLAKNFPFEILG